MRRFLQMGEICQYLILYVLFYFTVSVILLFRVHEKAGETVDLGM